jgi:hypothetical protein
VIIVKKKRMPWIIKQRSKSNGRTSVKTAQQRCVITINAMDQGADTHTLVAIGDVLFLVPNRECNKKGILKAIMYASTTRRTSSDLFVVTSSLFDPRIKSEMTKSNPRMAKKCFNGEFYIYKTTQDELNASGKKINAFYSWKYW